MSERFDVAVIGAGIEGLAAAATLARAGRSVIVLERRPLPGGSAAREEFHPGHRVSGLLPDAALTARALLAPLALESHGLRWRADEPALFVPDASGAGLLLRRDPARMPGELPPDEAARYAYFRASLARFAPLAKTLFDRPPPDAASLAPRELWTLAQQALRLRRLGEAEMFALLHLLPSAARDWMEDAFHMEALRTALVAPSLAGTVLGPRASGTSALVLLRECLAAPEPAGGPAALVDALVLAAHELGIELRCVAGVRAIRLDSAGLAGVELERGENVECAQVASSAGPAHTLLELLPAGVLPPACERAVQGFRARGTTAVLRLALARPPVVRGREQEPIEHALSASSLLDLERASDALKYRRFPEQPWIELFVPSRADPALAPPGQAVAAVLCHTVPHALEGGWNDDARQRLEQALLAALEALAPGAAGAIVGRELLTPVDIERRYGAAGGHVFDGELALDQLWLQRPSLALSRYATPIPGLFLCGSGSHPGGPFRGGAGVLAARAMLEQRPRTGPTVFAAGRSASS